MEFIHNLDVIAEKTGCGKISFTTMKPSKVDYHCKRCNIEISNSQSYDYGLCNNCFNDDEQIDKRTYLDELATESLECRLKKIEEWIYDHNKKQHYSPPLIMR